MRHAVLTLLLATACRFDPGPFMGVDDARPVDGVPGGGDASGSDGGMADATLPADAQTSFVIEAEDPALTSTADGTHSWDEQNTLSGFTGSGYIVATPGSGTTCAASDLFCGAGATYNFTVAVAGTYRVTFRHASPSGCCDSVFWSIGFDAFIEDFSPDVANTWTDDTVTNTVSLEPGNRTLLVRMREAGARIDHIRIERE